MNESNIKLLIILGIIICSILFLVIVIWTVKKFIKSISNSLFGQIIKAAKNAKSIEMQEYQRQKDVCGMTRFVEPMVCEDFENFNKNLLYTKVESNLRKIFNALENKNIDTIKNDRELSFIKNDVEEKIEDLKSMNKAVKYDAVKFHRHALKKYTKINGVATIQISSTLEYYYSEFGNDNINLSKKFNGLKKQTRYTIEFIYVYDESNFNSKQVAFGINCQNCGAPLKSLESKNCEFCGTYMEPINLKSWYMSRYSEDYN